MRKIQIPTHPLKEKIPFSACTDGRDFATLCAVDFVIVFLQLCDAFQVKWLEPQTPRKRGL
jgi:hypothetical protein